jgi:hypothetical protein
MVNRYLILVLLMLCTSCRFLIGEDDRLTFKRSHNVGERINLKGYYYIKDSIPQGIGWSTYFLYENGIILYTGSFRLNELEQQEARFKRLHFNQTLRDVKDCWGLYRIDGDSISYEKWYPSGGPPKITFVRKGVILNDTTFVMRSVSRSDGTEKDSIEEYYYFKRFYPKPDSTNQFIK